MSIEEIKREALLLDPATRAELAQALLNSLDAMTESEIERLWFQEAARRDAAITNGAAATSPADEVLARARARRA